MNNWVVVSPTSETSEWSFLSPLLPTLEEEKPEGAAHSPH